MVIAHFNPIALVATVKEVPNIGVVYRETSFVPDRFKGMKVKLYSFNNRVAAAAVLGDFYDYSYLLSLLGHFKDTPDEAVMAKDFTQEQLAKLMNFAGTASIHAQTELLVIDERDKALTQWYKEVMESEADRFHTHTLLRNYALRDTAEEFSLGETHAHRILMKTGALAPPPREVYDPLHGADMGYRRELDNAKVEARAYYQKTRKLPFSIDVKQLVRRTRHPALGRTVPDYRAEIPTHCPITGQKFNLRYLHGLGESANDMVVGRKSVEDTPMTDNLVLMSRLARSVMERDRLMYRQPRWSACTVAEWQARLDAVAVQIKHWQARGLTPLGG